MANSHSAGRTDLATDRRRARLLRANQARTVAATQEHPRQCRCARPLLDADGCVKCGLPVAWVACDAPLQAEAAEFCRRDHESISRRERRRRTGR